MIIHVLAFFLCASFGTELCAETADFLTPTIQSRREKEVAAFPDGCHMYDVNGKPVLITKELGPPIDSKGEVTFKHYTRQAPSRGRELKINDATSLKNSNFDSTKPTYIITHGWQNNENSSSCVLIRDAYLANIDCNVIVIDWSFYSMSIYYIGVSYKVKEVGEVVQRFIKWLYVNGLKADDVTLVGHSLGAHVMGLTGYKLTPQVNNIVGLDPALPMFNFAGVGEALTKENAKHVQIIHTNAGVLGYKCPHGHTDFYVNGGARQPGCCRFFQLPFVCSACSHSRAVEVFAESIYKTFNALRCPSYQHFEANTCGRYERIARLGGLNLQSVIPGQYFLWTSSKKPFFDTGKGSLSIVLLDSPPPIAPCRWLYG